MSEAGLTALFLPSSTLLLDCVKELPGLRSVDPGTTGHLQELHKAGSKEAAKTGLPSTMPVVHACLACSISALLQGVALVRMQPWLEGAAAWGVQAAP